MTVGEIDQPLTVRPDFTFDQRLMELASREGGGQ
jgi:hypothetical protein